MEEIKDDNSITNIGITDVRLYDINKALDEKENARTISLNGQLHVEFICDSIINVYFCGISGYEKGVMDKYLKSNNIIFDAKLNLLKELKYNKNNQELDKLIPNNLIKSLKIIGYVRNKFHHYYHYSEIIEQIKKNKDIKFIFMNKKLSSYDNIEELKEDFIKETKRAWNELMQILMELIKKKQV